MADVVAASPPALPHTPPHFACDVWTHWGHRYRARALVLLALNVLLFAGVANFAFWIRSGTVLAPTMEGYWDEFAVTFRFTGTTGKSLGAMLLAPISVQDVPMQIPILGLLMAALIAIPILISLLYRFWASVPFIALVGFLAVMPWLAITLLVSCVFASVRPFRSRYPFMSAMQGTVPAVIYLVFASKGTAEAVVGQIDPIDRIKFFAPWVLAIVAASLVYAIVLGIARLVKYRPGPLTPLLALMFGLPVFLFELNVGRDELSYRLLDALNEHHFADVDATVALTERTEYEWDRHPLPRPSFEQFQRRLELLWQFELGPDIGPYETELTRNQQEIVERCRDFIRRYPDSRYAGNVLYFQARALDIRVAPSEFRRTRWIRFFDEFPSRGSRATWEMLVARPQSPLLQAVAGLRIAQLDAREDQIERALDRLVSSIQTFQAELEGRGDSATSPGMQSAVWRSRQPEAGLRIPVERLFLEAHYLRDLLANNDDPVYGRTPLTGPRDPKGEPSFGLLDLDPRHDQYIQNLNVLLATYERSQAADNILLEIAKATSLPSLQIERLNALLAKYPDRDAAAEALFRLGLAYQSLNQPDEARARLDRLLRTFPESVWSKEARFQVRVASIGAERTNS